MGLNPAVFFNAEVPKIYNPNSVDVALSKVVRCFRIFT